MSNKYKLVPIEPTIEMLEADWMVTMSDANTKHGVAYCAYKAMLNAAPPEDVEPVAWRNPNDNHRVSAFMWQQSATHSKPVFARPLADKDAERFRFLIDMFLSRSSDDEIEHWEYSKCKLIFICDDTEDNLALSLRKNLDKAMGEVNHE